MTEEPVELRRLQPVASRDLATVVHRALAKDPARRYATALGFAEDLRRVRDGEPTVARPPGPLRRAWVVTLRHRTVVAVGAALLVGLLASLWFLGHSLLAQRRFEALAVVARAKEVQPEDPELAFMAMRTALDLAAEPEVIAAIHGVLPELKSWSLLRRTDARMQAVVWSPTRRFLVVNCAGGPAALHGADGAFLGELRVPGDDGERGAVLFPQRPAVAFAPDESAMWACIEATGFQQALGICRFELGADRRAFVGALPMSGERVLGVTSIAWSPDGRRLLVTRTSEKGAVASLHDADTGQQVASDLPMPPMSRGCAFLGDGTLVLPNGLWSPDGKQIRALKESAKDNARFVLVAGERIAVASAAGVQVYSTAGDHLGGREREDHRILEQLHHVEWSPQRDALLVSFADGECWILDASGTLLHSWNVGSSCYAHFMLDGKHIITGDSKGRVILWDRMGHMLDRLLGHRNNVHVAPLPGGDPLVVGWDGLARIWHVDRTLPGLPFRSGPPWARALVVGSLLVVADAEGHVRALDADGTVLASTVVRRGQVFLSPHRDGRTVWLTEYESGNLWRWDPGNGARDGPFAPEYMERNHPTSTAHLESGRLLMATGWEVPLRWFDPERKETSPYLVGFKASHVAATSGGRFAVAVGTDELGVIDVPEVKVLVIAADGETVRWSKSDPAGSAGARASALAVSRDGRHAVVGYMNGTVSVWDLDERRCIRTLHDHTDVVLAVAVSPDGRHVASATRQGHLAVRQLAAERPEFTWRSPDERLQSLSFIDDHTLVSTGIDLGRVRWWWWEPDRLREVLARVPLPALDADQQRDLARLRGR